MKILFSIVFSFCFLAFFSQKGNLEISYNNLEGVLRLGYEEFSIMTSYRFFDVSKGSLPKLNIGLNLVITQ